ncbi:hypothetical protein [Sphingomonas psychrotolerans]|uniref:WxL domain-containing protein n=1 Tax=Sphingomonas psychrotolerans TaxID=1327635 RepID=A0A2K8MG65_9SPHN|nr:hypothetical protein [Sphingomonas psychrotolerans]ATY32882.1 hypothetical protein CVN68_13635 [Sphingomonas psychrotolerans]
MKKLLSAAALALLSTAGVAQADDIAFSGQTPGVFGGTSNHSSLLGYAVGVVLSGGVGYNQFGLNAGNTQTASPTVTNTWLIKGTVTKDCSYYGGSSTAHTLDFGTIGVNTNSNTNVNSAFDMVSPATAVVNSTTAGCNFNNTVTLSKQNGAQGLLNGAAGGYDSNEFQANIPYSVAASFQGTTNTSAGAAGSPQTVTAATGDASKVWTGGAWRSDMTLTINAPTPGKALVAGNYQDTLTVELKAL